MKRLFSIATLLCVGAMALMAQAQQTGYFYQHMTAQACVVFQKYVLDLPTCQQYVFFLVMTTDPTVTAYRATIDYTKADGTAGNLVTYFDAQPFFPNGTQQTTAHQITNVDNITITSTSVIPLKAQAPAAALSGQP